MTRTTPELAPPLQASAPHQREDVWPLRTISVQQAPYTADLQWNRVSNLRPSSPGVETLPLGHRGLNWYREEQWAQKERSFFQAPKWAPIPPFVDIR
ncbi:hypothetical protein AVEN_82831-1 [Araneus ventricosus]|uniref:Uncharacterized protein n=1 Tax=Araneus ventricosus TaxID=182803 RepID=A0A4Y2F6M4_ARAVE|nr:hypothetical protein AVEN_82831-1 [Araneus ventricosus]